MRRSLFEHEHDEFRGSFRRFVESEMVPRAAEWDEAGIVDREIFRAAGKHGFLGMAIPVELGGGGCDDFRFNIVIAEELHRVGLNGPALGFALHDDMCLPYLLRYTTPEQATRWLPGIASGETITAIAMTEPSAGSDLASVATTARSDGGSYVLNGVKTFITNGINADLIVVAARTGQSGATATSASSSSKRARQGSNAAATSKSSASMRRTRPSCTSRSARFRTITSSERRGLASSS